MLAFDLETWGVGIGHPLQPWRARSGDSYVTLAITADASVRETNTHLYPDLIDLCGIVGELAKSNELVAGWNLKFDIAWLLAYGVPMELICKVKWLDAMLLAKRADQHDRHYRREELNQYGEDTSYSLKAEVRRYIPELADYEQGINYDIPNDPEHPDTIKLIKYGKIDVIATTQLASRYLSMLTGAELATAMLECACIPFAAQSWVDGIIVDPDKARALAQDCAANMARLQGELGIPAKVLSSPKQLGHLLFDEWQLPVLKETKTGAPSTEGYVLTKLGLTDDRVRKILEFRNYSTRFNKFAAATRESYIYNDDGCVRPEPIVAGTYTHRFTYGSNQTVTGPGKREGTTKKHKLPTGVALHQWQSAEIVRDVFQVPEGHFLAEFDFAGQEARLMADYSQDPAMLRIWRDDLDFHSYTGAQLVGVSYETFMSELADRQGDRKLGKLANLSLQYRTGWKKLMEKALEKFDLKLTEQEAKDIVQGYRLAYPGVPAYWDRAIADARFRGVAQTRGGTTVKLATWGTDNDWRYESTAINFPIQGTGAEMKLLAMHELRELLLDNKIRFAWDLHDGLYFYVPEQLGLAVCREIVNLMDALPYGKLCSWEPSVPMPVDCKTGPSWGQLKERKFDENS